MKKIEVRWISRDPDGKYDTWKQKPRKANGGYWACSGIGGAVLGRDVVRIARFDVTLRLGGLAKVTIKRQY